MMSESSALRAVAHGNGQTLAVGNNAVFRTTDGIRWENVSNAPDGDWRNVRYTGAGFAVWGASQLAILEDGETDWITTAPGIVSTMAGSGDVLVALTEDKILLRSRDGKNWDPPANPPPGAVEDIAATENTGFAAISDDALYHSKDGDEWEPVLNDDRVEPAFVDSFAKHFIATGRDGGRICFWTSKDGQKWEKGRLPVGTRIPRPHSDANRLYLYVGRSVLSSSDLESWTEYSFEGERSGTHMTAIASDGNTHLGLTAYRPLPFEAQSRQGTVYLRRIPKDGQVVLRQTKFPVLDLIHAHDRFIAVGYMELLLHSEDGWNWEGPPNPELEQYLEAAGYATPETVKQDFPEALQKTRTWTSRDGRTLEGKALDGTAESVRILRTQDNREFTIPLSDLDVKDQTLVRETLKSEEPRLRYAERVPSQGDNWDLVAGPFKDRIRSVAYGKGALVAVGHQGIIYVSNNNGRDWQKVDSPTGRDWRAIRFINDRFVAWNHQEIAVSADGREWRRALKGHQFQDIIAAGGRFFTFSRRGNVAVSDDGLRWKRAAQNIFEDSPEEPPAGQTEMPERFSSAAYGNGAFIATTTHGRAYTSSNGYEWEPKELPPDTAILSCGFFNGRLLVAGKQDGEAFAATSEGNGRWSSVSLPEDSSKAVLVTDEGGFLLEITPGKTGISSDGRTWAWHPAPTWERPSRPMAPPPRRWEWIPAPAGPPPMETVMEEVNLSISEAVLHRNTAVVSTAAGMQVLGPDGEWNQPVVDGESQNIRGRAFCHTGQRFVAVFGSQVLVADRDGQRWSVSNDHPSVLLRAMAASSSEVVAVSPQGVTATSQTGTDWSFSPPTSRQLVDVASDGQGFVAVGSLQLTILTSRTGRTWREEEVPTERGYFGPANKPHVTYGNGKYVVVTTVRNTPLLISSNGRNWSEIQTESGDPVPRGASVFYFDGQQFVTGGSGRMVSRDGEQWERQDRPGWVHDAKSIVPAGDSFLAVGRSEYNLKPPLLISRDGKAWQETGIHLSRDIFAITIFNDYLYASGSLGRIFRSRVPLDELLDLETGTK